MSDSATVLAVELDTDARLDELVAVEAVFRRAGFDVAVNATYERRSAAVAWMITITLGVPITAFVRALGAETGKDVSVALNDWVHDLWQSRTRPDGSIVLEDPDGTRVIVATRIPDPAIDALADVDWAAERGRYLVWDVDAGEWLDPSRRDHDAA